MRRARRAAGVAGGVALLSMLARCQLLWGPDVNPSDASTGRDAAADATADAPGSTCGDIGVPPRPLPREAGSADLDIAFALSSIDFGKGGTVHPLNLDPTCTCPGPGSCRAPDAAPCDGEGGTDNAARDLLNALSSGITSEQELNAGLAAGVSGAILRVQAWNGTAEDDTVVVSVYPALGVEGDAGLKLDGTDPWRVDRAWVADPPTPPFAPLRSAEQAWVTKGKLVAAFQSTTLIVGGAVYEGGVQPPLRLDLNGAFIVADLTPTSMTGTLAGRWPVLTLLKSIEAFPDPFASGHFLCEMGAVYDVVRRTVCTDRDIGSVSNLPASDCDALSLAIGFKAHAAKITSVGDGIDGGHPCGAAWKPTCN